MLALRNVTKSYNKGKIKAVDSLSLEVHKGEVFGFLGPNGAGKTTTIKMITGLLESDSGSITIDGINIKTNPVGAKKKFGFVPDSPQVYERITGTEYLNFLADIHETPSFERQALINELAGLFELKDALNDIIQSYSHGMQQKLVIIGALLHKPPVWILDEPMVGLDPRSAHNLKKLMRQHCDKGNCVFFSTHVLEVAEKLCDRIGIVRKGKLIFSGPMEELHSIKQEKDSLENIFLELTD